MSDGRLNRSSGHAIWLGPRSVIGESQQAGRRGLEPAGTRVEAAEVVLEIDVYPLATGRTGFVDRCIDQLATDATALVVGVYDDVEEKGVGGSIPGHVGEPDQTPIIPGGDPAETVVGNQATRIVIESRPMPETNRMEGMR
jgi:hypothetical protein